MVLGGASRVCGTRGSLRTMYGGGSAPSCCAFTHRVTHILLSSQTSDNNALTPEVRGTGWRVGAGSLSPPESVETTHTQADLTWAFWAAATPMVHATSWA